MSIKKGILIVATGHPNYGNMAYNLAASITAAEDMPVAVVYEGDALNHLNDEQRKVFAKVILLPKKYPTAFATKLHLDQLTPFDQTLYCDADMLWLGRKPSELFDQLNGTDFTCITEGSSEAPNPKYYFWADPNEIKKAYKVQSVYQTRSEVIYFEKGTKVFKTARELKPDEKLLTIRKFGEWVPDELYFNIALALLEKTLFKFMPAYWARLHNEVMPNLSVLYKDYFLLSFGSNAASPIMKRAYDNVMAVVCRKLGMPYMFKLKSKKEWEPGRLKI